LKRHEPYGFLKRHDPYGFLKRHDPTLGHKASASLCYFNYAQGTHGFLKRHDPYGFLKRHDPYGFLKRHDPTLGTRPLQACVILIIHKALTDF
jgi:hypothetical protein